ncbi:MAG: DUF3303 family protein [Anaerolineaceae bacterium]
MATTYVGFWRVVSPEAVADAQRKTGALPPEMAAKVRAFPGIFGSSCKLIGSWGVSGGEAPGVTVVEADSFADLAAINAHYAGWLGFEWHPTNSGGVPRDQ